MAILCTPAWTVQMCLTSCSITVRCVDFCLPALSQKLKLLEDPSGRLCSWLFSPPYDWELSWVMRD